MEVILIESKAFQELLKQLEEIKASVAHLKSAEANDDWIDNDAFIKLLKISRRTAQSYRNSNLIGFSQINNKIYYRSSDVQQLLERHFVKPSKQ